MKFNGKLLEGENHLLFACVWIKDGYALKLKFHAVCVCVFVCGDSLFPQNQDYEK